MSRNVVDQMGRSIEVPDRPQRIVSLVPSQTELLVDLGLEDRLVGLTRFCIHPAHIRFDKKRVGGTKDVKLDRVRALQPDLIIGNKEENDQEQIEALAKEFPVWMSDISNLSEALDMVQALGVLCQKEKEAQSMVRQIEHGFSKIQKRASKKVLYLIWKGPYMAAGKGTFINDMLEKCGWENVLDEQRYPTIDPINASIQPDIVLASSEPYPFKDKDLKELQALYPNAVLRLVDGEYFSWYGSRLLGAPDYFNRLLAAL